MPINDLKISVGANFQTSVVNAIAAMKKFGFLPVGSVKFNGAAIYANKNFVTVNSFEALSNKLSKIDLLVLKLVKDAGTQKDRWGFIRIPMVRKYIQEEHEIIVNGSISISAANETFFGIEFSAGEASVLGQVIEFYNSLNIKIKPINSTKSGVESNIIDASRPADPSKPFPACLPNPIDLSFRTRVRNALQALHHFGYSDYGRVEYEAIQMFSDKTKVPVSPTINEFVKDLSLVDRISTTLVGKPGEESAHWGGVTIPVIKTFHSDKDKDSTKGFIKIRGSKKYGLPFLDLFVEDEKELIDIRKYFTTLNLDSLRPFCETLKGSGEDHRGPGTKVTLNFEGNNAVKPLFYSFLIALAITLAVVGTFIILDNMTIASEEVDLGGSNSTGIIESIDTVNNQIHIRSTNDVPAVLDAVYIDGVRYSGTLNLNPGDTITLFSAEWQDFDVLKNQEILIAGSNNFRATSKS